MADLEKAKLIADRIAELAHKCRKCKHQRFAHLSGRCLDVTVKRIGEVQYLCRCKEFVPQDNLEYVEYVAKKKKLI